MIILILELATLAGLIICGALLILSAGEETKQEEVDLELPRKITKRLGRSKRRPKGQTGRKHPKRKRTEL